MLCASAGHCLVLHINLICCNGAAPCVQTEIDYKAECHSGDAIESLGSSIKEDTNGTGIRRCAACLLQSCCKWHAGISTVLQLHASGGSLLSLVVTACI